MFLFTLLVCVASVESADHFFFNGMGDFLCEYYGNEVCADPNEISRTVSTSNSDCLETCITCNETDFNDDLNMVSNANPNPPTGSQYVFGDSSSALGYCDSPGGTMTHLAGFSVDGQLDTISWYIDPTCDYGPSSGITFSILRPNDPQNACSFDVINSINLEKKAVNPILPGGSTVGEVIFDLADPQRRAMQFKAGDHLGAMWDGEGIMSYTSGSVDNICFVKTFGYNVGDSIDLTPVKAGQWRRVYSLQYTFTEY